MRAAWCWLAVFGCAVTIGAQESANLDPDHPEKFARGLKLFEQQIRSLLSERCLECHSGDDAQGRLDLSTREGLLKGGERGPAVLVGRGAKSLLVRLASRQQEPFMPDDGEPLSPEQLAALRQWIDLGAPYDRPLGAATAAGPRWTERTVPAEARNFWSFQPLRRADVPAVTDAAWCRTPIDRFLRSAQEGQPLVRAAEADRCTLIRRLCFDLTGLPPTPDDVNAFVDDERPDAYEQLVDRLLASPHYGERWARHWLDLARFAESHGFEHDTDRPTAFHYRDYVIQALNANQPYNEFVRWQLAGDEYAPHDRLAQMATGFLAAGVHSTQITKSEVERHRYDEMDDMLSTTFQALLGLSVGCARCHDHKFDPIPQADYYRLLSAFTTTVRSEVELDFDPVGYARAKAEFDVAHAPFEAAVAAYERDVLPQTFAAWRDTAGAPSLRPDWFEPAAMTVESQAGATVIRQADGSWLATGRNGNHDVYTLTMQTSLPAVRQIRIEALSDPSLKSGGPGRADNGNFALSTIAAEFQPIGSAEAQRLKIASARATFEQVGLPVAAALDDSPSSAWAVDPQFGRDHAAVFELASPLESAAQGVLIVRLMFQCNTRHNIGRLRVSLSTDELPPVNNDRPFRERIWLLLQRPWTELAADERRELFNWFKPQDAGWKALDDRRAEHAKQAPQPRLQKVLVATEGLTPLKLNTQAEQEYLPQTHFLRRGDPNLKDGVAELGFLQVLSQGPADSWKQLPPPGWRTSYQRRALADWLTDVDDGAGHLLARVIVNRLWQHHFGRGLVATPSDFGSRGDAPTHPELLDWLAGELIASDWDLKHLHRLMVTSAIYRREREPRRLEAELVRDAILAVADLLDDRMFGPGTLDEAHQRRSLYFTVKRSQLVPMMTVFDAPDGTTTIGERPQTTVAPQALALLNGALVRRASAAAAQRAGRDVASAVRDAYRCVLQRAPTEAELAEAVAFLSAEATPGAPAVGTAALTDFYQVLLCLNEFVYVD